MKKLFTLVLSLATATAFAQPAKEPEKKIPYQFVLLSQGLAKPKTVLLTRQDSIEYRKKPYEPVKIIKPTDSIPAKINTVFGISFKITGPDTFDVHYTAEWIYPTPLKDEDGRKYKSDKRSATMSSNKDNTATYVLLKANELLKGTWLLNMYVEGKLMGTQKFIMY